MFNKVYLSRSQTKAMSSEYPIGDPTGGAAYGEFNDPVSAIVSAGASLIGSAMSADAAESAADTQAAAADRQLAEQRRIFEIQNKQQAPFRGAGYSALNTIGTMLPGEFTRYDAEGMPIGTGSGSGYLTQQFTNQDLNNYLAPNYAFNLEQGQGAVRNLANSSGGLIGGNAIRGVQDYTQNFAGNAYNNAFNQFQTQRGNIYNTLAGIAGIGQTATNQTGANATNYGTNVANLDVGAANARAAGTVGAANAYSGGIQNAGNMYMLSNLLGQRGTVPGYTGGYSSGGGVGAFLG
jgi:hypothetical protein